MRNVPLKKVPQDALATACGINFYVLASMTMVMTLAAEIMMLLPVVIVRLSLQMSPHVQGIVNGIMALVHVYHGRYIKEYFRTWIAVRWIAEIIMHLLVLAVRNKRAVHRDVPENACGIILFTDVSKTQTMAMM